MEPLGAKEALHKDQYLVIKVNWLNTSIHEPWMRRTPDHMKLKEKIHITSYNSPSKPNLLGEYSSCLRSNI